MTGVSAYGEPVDLAPNATGLPLSASFDARAVEAYRQRIRPLIARSVQPLAEAAEASARFPHQAIAQLGSAGLFRERWEGAPHGDPGKAVILAEELAIGLTRAVGIGIGVHLEAVLSMLLRFGQTALLRGYAEAALAGEMVGCVAASEDVGGCDLLGVQTLGHRTGDGWRIVGEKSYVSLGGAADFALVPFRSSAHNGAHRAQLTVALVPGDMLEVRKRHVPAGLRGLETVRLSVDAQVSTDAVLGKPGAGLRVLTWGLTHERLVSAAQAVGLASLAIGLATAHLERRRVGGQRLMERQALRLRLADLASEVSVLQLALHARVASGVSTGSTWARDVASLKVRAARLGERVLSECMHFLGGQGYLEDETPLAQMWRDVRLARLGGGTDEVMLEMVAAGLVPDHESYERFVTARASAAERDSRPITPFPRNAERLAAVSLSATEPGLERA